MFKDFTLTEMETACGVTLEAVAEQVPLCAVFEGFGLRCAIVFILF